MSSGARKRTDGIQIKSKEWRDGTKAKVLVPSRSHEGINVCHNSNALAHFFLFDLPDVSNLLADSRD